MKTTTTMAVAFVGLLIVGSTAQAQSLPHIDDLANIAERQTRVVALQSFQIRSMPLEARQLRENAISMYRLAQHIHDVGHTAADAHRPLRARAALAHINRDVEQLDRLMHATQDLVAEMQANLTLRRDVPVRGAHHAPAINLGRHFSISLGSGCYQGHGGYGQAHVDRRDLLQLSRIQRSLGELERTVHHLVEDTEATCCHRR